MTIVGSPLQYRFLARTLVAAMLFAATAGIAAYKIGAARADASAHRTITSLQKAVEKTAAIAVFAHDKTLMREVMEGVARDPLVRRVEISDASGNTLLQSAPRLSGDMIGADVRQALSSPFDASETIGTLHIEIDGTALHQVAQREAGVMALMMVTQAALIAAVIYLTGVKLVSRPIVRLARALRAMPPGSPERLTVPAGHEADEIGTLVHSANDLLNSTAEALDREIALRQEIEAMEAQYRQIFDSTSAGIFVLDRHGGLINGNPTVLKVIGGGVKELRQLRGRDFLELVFARPDRVRTMIDQASARRETVSADLEMRTFEGQTRWAHCLLSVQGTPMTSTSTGMQMGPDAVVEGVLYDITERKEVESDARRRAERDELTGVLNRAGIDATVDHFLELAHGEDSLSLLYLDLDGFKQVNDRHGHQRGDEVLQLAVARIQSSLRRQSDVVGRIGGDEFVVAMTNSGATGAAACSVATNIVEHLCEPFNLDGGIVARMGVSIGIASYPRNGRDRRELLRAADDAMYYVKRHGKNAFVTAVSASAKDPAAGEEAAQPSIHVGPSTLLEDRSDTNQTSC